MIRARQKTYNKYTLSSTLDDYKQTNTVKVADGTIEAYIEKYSRTIISNPLYVDVQYIGVTKNTLTLNDFIVINNEYYQVIEFTQSPRYNKFLLRKSS